MNDEIILYTTPDGHKKIAVHYEDETVWLTQKELADLFEVDVRTINEHLQTIFQSGELMQESVIRKIRITAADGKSYLTNIYNLDAIISVGYRVNSEQATRFRIWATQTLKEYMLKGFVLDDERLKQGQRFGVDYFDELLERIRETCTEPVEVSAPANGVFIKRSPTSTSSAASITIKTPKSRCYFSRPCKTNCIGPSP